MSVALLFSPQGSQAVGMGRALAETSAAARATFEEADAALGWPVSSLCWAGPEAELNDTRQTQPCLVATSLACLSALREALPGLRPSFVAGHSVGEYAALVAGGSLELPDALRLVARRGKLMAEAAADGGMAAVIGLERAAVARVITDVAADDDLVVANDNAPGQVVISGRRAAIEAAERPLVDAGARRVMPLNVSGPFHSPAMRSVGEALAAAFDGVAWRDASPPVVSNVTAEPVREVATIRRLLAEQVASPVEWVASVRRMAADGVDTFVECGPGSALVGMVRRIVPEARTLAVGDPDGIRAAVDALRPAAAEASVQG